MVKLQVVKFKELEARFCQQYYYNLSTQKCRFVSTEIYGGKGKNIILSAHYGDEHNGQNF